MKSLLYENTLFGKEPTGIKHIKGEYKQFRFLYILDKKLKAKHFDKVKKRGGR